MMKRTLLVIAALAALGVGVWQHTSSTDAVAEVATPRPAAEQSTSQDTLKYFDGIAVKRLSKTDIDPKTSHQHEINGVKALQELFGTEKQQLRGRFIYYGDKIFTTDVALTWYNASRDPQKSRYRLYYQDNPVIKEAHPSDTLLIARSGKDEVIAIVTPHESLSEAELVTLFGVKKKVKINGEVVPKKDIKVQGLLNTVHEQLQQTGKVPVEVSLWKDVDTGELTVKGKVEKVKDGDTINIGGAFDIRLLGIDAPEHDQTCTVGGKEWDCGTAATKYLTELALGKEAECTNQKKEKYGRYLSICKIDGKIINEQMVEKGLAVIYYSEEFADAERKARLAQAGLWGSEFINPADWRHRPRH